MLTVLPFKCFGCLTVEYATRCYLLPHDHDHAAAGNRGVDDVSRTDEAELDLAHEQCLRHCVAIIKTGSTSCR